MMIIFNRIVISIIFLGFCCTADAASKMCTQLTFSGAADWYPISYYDNQQKFVGDSLEIARVLSNELDVDLNVVEGLPWLRQLNLLEEGKIDFIAAYYNDERAKRYIYSEPFSVERVKVFFRKNEERQISKIEELDGLLGVRPLAAYLGNEVDSFSRDNSNIFQIDNTKVMFRMLFAKRVDYVITAHRNGMRAIKSLAKEESVSIPELNFAENSIHLIFSKNMDCQLDFAKVNRIIQLYAKS